MNELENNEKQFVAALCACDAQTAGETFYRHCRYAYNILDRKYQLRDKPGMDFYSLAHDYYLYLLAHHFQPLLTKPAGTSLQSWMVTGFRFVVLDALKAYKRESDARAPETAEMALERTQSRDRDDELLRSVADSVAAHYTDTLMGEIAHKIIYEGYKQKEVAEQLGLTPSAVNQRYRRMMEEVVIPCVMQFDSGNLESDSVRYSSAP